jgi:hypothetical protein
MTTDQMAALETLLGETEAAHGAYETTELNGVYDQEWPHWYAAYAVEHGIGEIVGRDVGTDELEGLLTAGWAELQQADPRPAEPWTTSLARRLAEQL